MANLKLDDSGRPIPQIQNDAGTDFDPWKGENNAGRITGDVAHDAADAGKPVKIGGKAVDPAALPADVAAADRVNALFDLKGRLFVRQDVASALPTGAATAAKQDTIISHVDGLETLLTAIKDTDGIKKIVDPLPATNQEGTALASAARTVTTNSSDLSNSHKNGVHIILDVTAITDTPSITLKIEGKDPASGKYYTVLEGAAVTGVSTNIYKVFPAATAAANTVANDIIPKTWRITVTHADADSITYSVGYSLM